MRCRHLDTGNMKFMLNGAVTLGTLDGANVEIRDLVGDDNIYIFGKTKDEVLKLRENYNAAYHPDEYYNGDELIKKLIDFITGDELLAIGDKENLCRLKNELINKDWFMTLIDLKEYIDIKERIYADYAKDEIGWSKMALVNIANAGFFSSDRTIAEYNRDIWGL